MGRGFRGYGRIRGKFPLRCKDKAEFQFRYLAVVIWFPDAQTPVANPCKPQPPQNQAQNP